MSYFWRFAEVYDEYAYQCNEDKLIKFENRAKRKVNGIWAEQAEEVPIDEVDTGYDISEINIPIYTGSRVITCSQLSSRTEAKEWLDQGHTYLDADRDGNPCESLPLYWLCRSISR